MEISEPEQHVPVARPHVAKRLRLEQSESERESVTIPVTQSQRATESEMRLLRSELQSRDLAAKIEGEIRRKEIAFKKVYPMTCEKPSDSETRDYLKKMGLTTGFAKTSFRSGIPRPSFTPSG